MTALCLIWAFFRIPETKNFTFAEIDLLFQQGVPARKFAQHRGKVHPKHLGPAADTVFQPEKA